MTSFARDGGAMPDDDAKALILLARKGAFIARAALIPSMGDDETVEVYCQRHGDITVAAIVPAGCLRSLLGSQLASESGARYVISRRGRETARRIRTELIAAGTHIRSRRIAWAKGESSSGDRVPQPSFNPEESPLSKLRARASKSGEALLTREQYEAGERLSYDLWRAGLTPRVTQRYDGIPQIGRSQRAASGASASVSEGTEAARERALRALAAVGTEYIDLLIDVCGHLKGLEEIERTASLPQRSARRFLQHALTALARYYGLLPTESPEVAVRSRLQHWGAPKYRLPARRAPGSN